MSKELEEKKEFLKRLGFSQVIDRAVWHILVNHYVLEVTESDLRRNDITGIEGHIYKQIGEIIEEFQSLQKKLCQGVNLKTRYDPNK